MNQSALAAGPPIITNIPFHRNEIGASTALTRTLSMAGIQLSAVISGAANPAQVDAVFAAYKK